MATHLPSHARASRSAPAWARTRTVSACPAAAAQCKGVLHTQEAAQGARLSRTGGQGLLHRHTCSMHCSPQVTPALSPAGVVGAGKIRTCRQQRPGLRRVAAARRPVQRRVALAVCFRQPACPERGGGAAAAAVECRNLFGWPPRVVPLPYLRHKLPLSLQPLCIHILRRNGSPCRAQRCALPHSCSRRGSRGSESGYARVRRRRVALGAAAGGTYSPVAPGPRDDHSQSRRADGSPGRPRAAQPVWWLRGAPLLVYARRPKRRLHGSSASGRRRWRRFAMSGRAASCCIPPHDVAAALRRRSPRWAGPVPAAIDRHARQRARCDCRGRHGWQRAVFNDLGCCSRHHRAGRREQRCHKGAATGGSSCKVPTQLPSDAVSGIKPSYGTREATGKAHSAHELGHHSRRQWRHAQGDTSSEAA